MDNARERRFGNGREPRVLWKIHAAFIANLLHSGGGSEGKDRDSTRGAAMPWADEVHFSLVGRSVTFPTLCMIVTSIDVGRGVSVRVGAVLACLAPVRHEAT